MTEFEKEQHEKGIFDDDDEHVDIVQRPHRHLHVDREGHRDIDRETIERILAQEVALEERARMRDGF